MVKYNSINNIPAKLFFEILDTKDYTLLQSDNAEYNLEEVFVKIYDEFFLKSDKPEAKLFLELQQNIALMTYKVESVKQVLYFLTFTKTTKEMREKLLKALISIGININLENDFLEEVQNVLQIECGILDNEINLAKNDLESMSKQNKDSVFNFYEHLISLENAHERNLDDEMVLIKFVEYEKLAIKKIELSKKRK